MTGRFVLERLTGGDAARERARWEQAPLDRLREVGAETGLAGFLDDVATRLMPRLDPSARPR